MGLISAGLSMCRCPECGSTNARKSVEEYEILKIEVLGTEVICRDCGYCQTEMWMNGKIVYKDASNEN